MIATTTTTVLRPFLWDHPGEPVPEENLWSLWCKGRLTGGRHTDHQAGCNSIRTKQFPPPPSPNYFTGRMPFLPPNEQCQSTEGKGQKNWVVRYWHCCLSRARCKWFTYGSADATATPWCLAPVKSRMVCLSGVGLPRLSWKKGH